MERQESPRRLVRGPKGRWKATPAAESAEELQQKLDRIALSNHLAGFNAPKLKLN
jgi:hypothetical protein